MPRWFAFVLAIGGGAVYDAGFPARDWWPLAFVGLGMIVVALIGRSARSAALLGYLAGAAFYLLQVSWTSLYLGPVPWVALSLFESVFFMLGCLAVSLAYRWVPRAWPTRLGRLGLLPVVVAGLWTAREAVSNVWPYGGFAWGRAALSQSESPFAPLVAWVGISGLTFVMVWLVALIIECGRAVDMRALPRAVIAVGAATLVLAVPAWPAITSGTVSVGAVQGNGPAGYFDDAAPGDVMNAQITATTPLIGKKLDMVVWPEGSADIDPTRNGQSAAELDYLSRNLDAPMIVGAITHRDGKYFNTSLLWKAGRGAVDYYDKKHPVPFGEYVPDRSFWEPFAPDLLGLIQRQYTPGTRSNVFDVNGVKAGVSICFDIVDDGLLTDMMHGGAQLIVAQTNNADFGTTEENVQQLAIARLRAIESARSIVNISTVGTSQIIGPDGRTIVAVPAYKPEAMVAAVPLGTTTTPGVLFAQSIERFVAGLGLAGLLVAAFAARPPSRRAPSPRLERSSRHGSMNRA